MLWKRVRDKTPGNKRTYCSARGKNLAYDHSDDNVDPPNPIRDRFKILNRLFTFNWGRKHVTAVEFGGAWTSHGVQLWTLLTFIHPESGRVDHLAGRQRRRLRWRGVSYRCVGANDGRSSGAWPRCVAYNGFRATRTRNETITYKPRLRRRFGFEKRCAPHSTAVGGRGRRTRTVLCGVYGPASCARERDGPTCAPAFLFRYRYHDKQQCVLFE